MATKKATAKKATKKATAKKATKKATAKKATAKKATKKATAKKATAAKSSDASMRVATTQVKEFMKAQGLRSSSDLPDAVSTEVEQILSRAADRARSNNRATVRPSDL